MRKSLLLAGKWPDRDQTCTRCSPGKPAYRVCSRSRSKVTWYAHFLGFLEWATPSLTVWFTTHWRRRRYSLMLLSMKCQFKQLSLWLLLSQFFHRVKFSSVIDSLLKGTPNRIIHGINIRAVWAPHVRLDEVDVLFFGKSVVRIKGRSIDISSGVCFAR